jgi:hypothetical protein
MTARTRARPRPDPDPDQAKTLSTHDSSSRCLHHHLLLHHHHHHLLFFPCSASPSNLPRNITSNITSSRLGYDGSPFSDALYCIAFTIALPARIKLTIPNTCNATRPSRSLPSRSPSQTTTPSFIHFLIDSFVHSFIHSLLIVLDIFTRPLVRRAQRLLRKKRCGCYRLCLGTVRPLST